jgi:sensor histidine kinase YesM
MYKSTDLNSTLGNPLIRFISDRKFRWLRHILFIITGLILAFKGDIGIDRSPELNKAVLIVDACSFLFILGMIYLMMEVFIPKFLFRSKLLLFIGSFILIISLIYLAVWFFDFYFLRPLDPEGKNLNMLHIEFSIVHFIQIGAVASVLLGAVVGMKVFKKWIGDIQHMNEIQQINLRSELEQLKSQVNPHFLFNTLNNLLVLTKTDPEKASLVLLGLSDLLRYQLYDSARDKIVLSKDIAFIHNLLALEKIRKDDFTYEVHTEGNIDGITLPPFLFIPFVENAIKHGASSVGHCYLTLRIRVENKRLFFYAENSKPPVAKPTAGGIGLKNIQRRLELLYPDTHELTITDEPSRYIVNLILPL